ncbi:subtilisin-like protease 1 [Lolium rigidum]|uniref:subtilisin-like protease 1 n=1 Tax=Lolium rigidum TaxID=89674 RepID=UPI001F5D8EBE|nr:subtilisin-like protease 1 [Lolium rigidum]
MAAFSNFIPTLLLFITLFFTPGLCYINPAIERAQKNTTETSAYRTYIVLVDPPRSSAREEDHRRWHESFLLGSCGGESSRLRLLHSYTQVFSGFAARLTGAELDAVAKKPGFVRAFPERTLQLMTTHTPEFLGLRNGTGFWSNAKYGKGVIVGLLDTGIYAAHPSFNDHGVPPPPSRWKGSCKMAGCNNKLIGAKSLVGNEDPDDTSGHGTHTSSIVAGNFVPGASYHGIGTGTAAGIAPGAHIAMYKVCKNDGCDDSAILAGLDAAIKDGVDVLSLSHGFGKGVRFDQDPIAIGAFSAISKGITVVCAAGNEGPTSGFLSNDAPWLLTVAAGSVDRSFQAEVCLGNGKRIYGQALTQEAKPSSKSYPLIFSEKFRYCEYDEDNAIVGKILVCESMSEKNQYYKIPHLMIAGAAGVVLFNNKVNGYTIDLLDYNSRVVQVTEVDGVILTSYVSSPGTNSVAAITYNNTLVGIHPAPVVASFSSRGPSTIDAGVLKPDILAPGLNILAAWRREMGSTWEPYNIISGTSMATPHVSGVVALIKSIHPTWSPAAIKSAILTTSDIVDSRGGPILDHRYMKASAYDTGAGHVNPTRAADPGLVYDLSIGDYAGYICWLLGDHGLATIMQKHNSSLNCATLPKIKNTQLNYPMITVPMTSMPFTVNRTVTNVGPSKSTYTVKVDASKSMVVHVFPEKLTFSKVGEKKTFSLTVSSHVVGKEESVEGSLRWVSEKHVVRSPIVASIRVKDSYSASAPF